MIRKRTLETVARQLETRASRLAISRTVALCTAGALAAVAFPSLAVASPIVFSDAGSDAASIQDTVDAFRSQLDSVGNRSQINWDGTPDVFSAPNNLPADFFNVNVPRGVVFSTPGSGFQVSGAPGVAPIEFDNIDPSYSGLFAPFSAPRLFTALDSTVTDVNFFVPGTDTPATTFGFGVVFSDVDIAGSTAVEYFDEQGNSLGTFDVEAVPDQNESFSFLGVFFDEGPVVSKVRITSGNQILAPGATEDGVFTFDRPEHETDLVVMDDFIFGEPVAAVAVPEPSTVSLLGMAALALLGSRRRRVSSPC